MLGLDVCNVGALHGAEGALDRRTSSLFVSDSTSQAPALARRRFTIAHELGHYSLAHAGDVHQRVPRSRSESKPIPEQEADRFAVEFLTPASIVPIVFDFNFGRRLDHMKLSEDEAFLLSHDFGESVSVAEFNRMDVREFAKRIAVAKWFGRQFDSMCNKFGVSIETMAIRLLGWNWFTSFNGRKWFDWK